MSHIANNHLNDESAKNWTELEVSESGSNRNREGPSGPEGEGVSATGVRKGRGRKRGRRSLNKTPASGANINYQTFFFFDVDTGQNKLECLPRSTVLNLVDIFSGQLGVDLKMCIKCPSLDCKLDLFVFSKKKWLSLQKEQIFSKKV